MLVYIHGGFLHYGSGHDEKLSPSAQLAADMNAVIVSFNYRLNVFGWLARKVSQSLVAYSAYALSCYCYMKLLIAPWQCKVFAEFRFSC